MRSGSTSERPLELADIVRKHGAGLSIEQRRALRDIACCRTVVLGGHVFECDQCGHRQIAYNSCRNRHCPKCQAAARAEWLEARASELLPVPYFHVVFTLPESIAALALRNPRVVYNLLFRAASQTLLEVAANPQHLGARIGVLAVLHTWGQNLLHHPHLHCVVPGGGISRDAARWIACRPKFFLPVRILSRVFRGKCIELLRRARQRGQLRFVGSQMELHDDGAFEAWLDQTVRHDWIVYGKPPFGGPQQVLKYLARYTHRVAISNRRLLKLEDGRVTFRWKDYGDGNTVKTMVVSASEFLRRFVLHVLPRGFVKIRHFGFLANRDRGQSLDLVRRLLGGGNEALPSSAKSPGENENPIDQSTDPRCDTCRQGRMRLVEEFSNNYRGLPLLSLLRAVSDWLRMSSRSIQRSHSVEVLASLKTPGPDTS